MLRCSEWWVKEQARRRRIPFCWIGGSYLFTEEHIAAIVRLFEVRPVELPSRGRHGPARVRPTSVADGGDAVPGCVPGHPRRGRQQPNDRGIA